MYYTFSDRKFNLRQRDALLKGAENCLVHSGANRYCQSVDARIYSVPSLAPLANKVSQVEMEAGDCEGRLPPLFLPGLWTLAFGL